MNVLITGANRGIGAQFTRHYLNQGATVWACYRQDKGELETINHTQLHCLQWDVTKHLNPRVADSPPKEIHLLINNAGVYGSSRDGQELLNVTEQKMIEVFRVNAIAPLSVVQQLLPALKQGRARIANMSSKMGSVDDNTSGGTYAYRASKSALCNISRSMAHDLAASGIHVITLHPGWVRTDMTHQTGLIDVTESVAGLSQVIEHIEHYPPGAFVAYDGQVIPF